MYPKPPAPKPKSMTTPPPPKGSSGPAGDLARKKAGKRPPKMPVEPVGPSLPNRRKPKIYPARPM